MLEVGPCYKYLGAYFTSKLCWAKMIGVLCKQASKAIAHIFKCQNYFGYFPPEEAFKLFDAMVQPIVCYASPVWGTSHIFVLNVHR